MKLSIHKSLKVSKIVELYLLKGKVRIRSELNGFWIKIRFGKYINKISKFRP